jgi:hypothetical protein
MMRQRRARDLTRVDLPRLDWNDGDDTVPRLSPSLTESAALPLVRVIAQSATMALPLVWIDDTERVQRRARAERVAWVALLGVVVGMTLAIAGAAFGLSA